MTDQLLPPAPADPPTAAPAGSQAPAPAGSQAPAPDGPQAPAAAQQAPAPAESEAPAVPQPPAPAEPVAPVQDAVPEAPSQETPADGTAPETSADQPSADRSSAGESPAQGAGPEAVPPAPAPPPRTPLRERRGARAVVRWGLAVVLCAGLGAGSAAYLTSLHREDVPGLGTKSDGRWDYPALSLPALREDEAQPRDRANTAGIHFADPRDLLLPAPAGAKPDKALPGGVVPVDRFVAEYGKDDRAKLRDALDVTGLRQVTARGWTMPDGTHARVYVLRFPSSGYATSFLTADIGARSAAPAVEPRGSSLSVRDEGWGEAPAAFDAGPAYVEKAPFGARQVRHGYLRVGDTVAFVVTDHPGRTPAVPFRQMMILQGQLLA
ncbi:MULTISPECIES: hypothetical protein [unclassified Streptomyces]|uniref:hypothetical protein n=1 Tax=unclassified Streptomyces TaxID=2593676 RepID=UPI00081D530A|nr:MULTISPECIES: hypothetical protein [unclassified Streptomyces]SCE90922.1 hypothetical protein GA0115257_104187 [Streptomyces sp. LcepLS]